MALDKFICGKCSKPFHADKGFFQLSCPYCKWGFRGDLSKVNTDPPLETYTIKDQIRIIYNLLDRTFRQISE